MHAQNPGSLARAALTAAALRIDERAHQVYATNLERPGVRQALFTSLRAFVWRRMLKTDNASRPLTAVQMQMIELAGAGATDAQLMLFEVCLRETREALMHPHGRRPLDVLDMAECVEEGRENQFTLRRRIRGATPQQLREEAQVNRREAATQLERASVLELKASELEGQRTTAIARLQALGA